jgi:hypothetical protein
MGMSPDLPWLLILLGACTDAVTWSRGRDLSADTWQAAGAHWRGWLRNELRYGGSGHGSGSGYGCGDGYGDGYGDGHGYGHVYGSGYGHGYGHVYGDGYGYGSRHGHGSGYGDGYGDGYESGSGYGDGYGDGYESGSGHGDGSGDGYAEQTWRDVVALEFDDGTRLGGNVRAAAIGLLGARLDEIEA